MELASFIRCYPWINCQVTFIGCVWQSVCEHKGRPRSLLFSDLSSSLSPQDSMELVFKQSKAVAVTSMSFPHGDVNNFVVGSEDGSVYMACRHGRWVPPKHHRGNWGSVFSPPRTERQINVTHSPPGVAQMQHSISCWLRFLQPSHPVFLFCLSVMFAKVIQYKQGTHAEETNRSFPVLFFFFSSCLWVSVDGGACLRLVIPGKIKRAGPSCNVLI